MRTKYLYTIILVLLLCGCKKNDSIITDIWSINRWTYSTFSNNYLWAHTLPSIDNTDLSLSPVKYFDTYIRYRKIPNIAIEDDVMGDRFSYIKATKGSGQGGEYSSFGNNTLSSTTIQHHFGFEVRFFVLSSLDNIISCEILYVMPGSPADRAGIKRGEKFNSINSHSMPMNYDTYTALLGSESITLHFNMPTERAVTLNRDTYYDTPVLFDSIFELPQKCGYLVYNHFTVGDDNRFNNQLNDVFAKFHDAGVETLILDLRYNGGGEIKAAIRLASLITRRELLSHIMMYKESTSSYGAPKNFEAECFLSEANVGNYNMNAKRIYIITSKNTASASELIIHTLKPFYGSDLICVGERTLGKNVGGVKITNNRFLWELNDITIRIYDKNKISDYESGIDPDAGLYISEVGSLVEFGDSKSDVLLRAVFSHISGRKEVGRANSADEAIPLGVSVHNSIPDRGLITDHIVIQ